MFPSFLVVTTLIVPATPTAPEKNELLESRPANTQAEAEQLALSRANAYRELKVLSANFGPGAPTVQSAIFVQQSATSK
jgi:hypothetical protein